MDWQKERKWYNWFLKLLWAVVVLGFLTFFILIFSVSRSDIPSFIDLENPEYDFASIIYDTHGTPFGKYYVENREEIAFEIISPNVLNALLSTEDERFMSHSGIDVWALFRVAFKTILFQQESAGGGSTISQQLAKLLYSRPSLSGKSGLSKILGLVKIKLKEWLVAVRLEKSYTKEEILAMYLNKFEFINGAHGVQAAAQIYFGKNQDSLSVEEAATLVGMLQNPSRYNPNRFPERTAERRNTVLHQMYRKDHIDKPTRDTLSAKEIDLSQFKKDNLSEGPAPYFRAELTKWLRKTLNDPLNEKPEGGKYDIYTDGLKIHTTIDLNYQSIAEDVVNGHMKTVQDRYWKAWRGMNPFSFEADSLQQIKRPLSVERRIHYSDRYLNLFNKHFSKIQNKIVDFEIAEPALRIILSANIEDEGIASIENERLQEAYGRLSKKNIWTEIKGTWKEFRKAYKEEFDTKINLKVFDFEKDEIEKEMSPRDSVIYHLRHLQTGMLAVDPKSGKVKVWVGGVDHNRFKFDHIMNRRQVGSTIKPFVYSTAISLQGMSPCRTFDDIQYTIAPGDADFLVDAAWSPANANESFTGNEYNLYQGLLYSKNSITVAMVKEMGSVELIRDLLHNVGISKEERLPGGRLLIPRTPSICLGSVDLSVFEMTGAYTTFANGGIYTKPIFVDYIEDRYGKIIYRAAQESRIAINPKYNAVMVDMLRNNTGGRFGMGMKSQNGGKTGTTNDYADAWFMGITPNLVVGTWVGGDEKWVRFFTLDHGQGFVQARPMFQEFIKKLEKDSTINYNSKTEFPLPPQGFYELIDCDKYKEIKVEDEQAMTAETRALSDDFDDDEFEDFDDELEDFDEDETHEPSDTTRINRIY